MSLYKPVSSSEEVNMPLFELRPTISKFKFADFVIWFGGWNEKKLGGMSS